MMGLYPDNATDPSYTFTTPVFDKITLQLSKAHHGAHALEIEVRRPNDNTKFIDKIEIDGKRYNSFRISHADLLKADKVVFYLGERK